MLQKKEYQQQIPITPTKPNVTKEGIPTTTKIPITPTKPNVTKEGIHNNKDTNNTDKT